MECTEKNFNVARSIIDILAKEKYTIAETADILSYVNKVVWKSSMVQMNGETEKLLSLPWNRA